MVLVPCQEQSGAAGRRDLEVGVRVMTMFMPGLMMPYFAIDCFDIEARGREIRTNIHVKVLHEDRVCS